MKGMMQGETIYRVVETDAPEGDRDVAVVIGSGVGRRFVARCVSGERTDESHGTDGDGILLVRVFLLAGRDTPGWKDTIRGWGELGRPVVVARAGDCSVAWTSGQALVAAAGESVRSVLAEVVEFAVGEDVLCDLERQLDGGWAALERDAGSAFRVDGLDRSKDAEMRDRALATMQRRLLFMRWEPLWLGTGSHSGARMTRLGETLREEAQREDRCVTLDGRLESAEYIYELVGQRAGEFRHAREGHWIEWLIVVLLAAELVVMLLDYLG